MRILVVGGHTRNIGKTALVVDLLRAFPEAAWTAVKITQYGHGLCSREGKVCDCAPDEHTFALDEEHDPATGTDTSRFLAAGAAHALWLRTKQGHLAEALPVLREALDRHAGAEGNVIIESNTLLQFLRPRLYVVVLDPTHEDFKESARLHLDRADAFVFRQPAPLLNGTDSSASRKVWGKGVPERLIERISQFHQPLGDPLPQALLEWVRAHFFPVGVLSTRNNSYLPS
jgi:hypothetical protein